MKDNLDIEKLFKEKFESFDPAVDARVWENIASSVSAKAAAGTAGTVALWVKSLVVGTVAASIGIGAWVYFGEDEVPTNLNTQISQLDNKQTVLLDEEVKVSEGGGEASNEPATIIEGEEESLGSVQVDDEYTLLSEDEITSTFEKETLFLSSESEKTENVISQKSGSNIDSEVNMSNKQSSVEEVVDSQAEDREENGAAIDNNSVTAVEKSATVNSTKVPGEPNKLEIPAIEPEKEASTIDETTASAFEQIPNVFTPDNDGRNDFFFVKSENIKEFFIVIYTRNNVKVYESTDPNFNWDGYETTGNKVPDGIYYYLIKAVGADGKLHSIPGQLNVR